MVRVTRAQRATKTSAPRGFVLSFSTFVLALMLIITAQLQHSHLQTMQLDSMQTHQTAAPARLLRDIALDFNALTGQTISIDQNRDTATFHIKGKMPNALSTQTNLLRYQTNLSTLARDSNASIFLDLNQSISDGNFWGRTNHLLRWREGFDVNRFRVFPTDTNYYPRRIDVNIFSEVPYESVNITTGACCFGDITFTDYSFNYTDTNNDHNHSYSGTLITHSSFSFNATYSVDGITYSKVIGLGTVSENPAVSTTPLGTIIFGAPNVTWNYSIAYTLPNDINGTFAGYDFNTTLRGIDFNADTNTIWTYGR